MRKTLAVFVAWALIVYSVQVFWEPLTHAQGASPCDRTVAISVAAAASQTVVAAVPGATIYVCAMVLSGDTLATTATIVSGSTSLTGILRMCDECNISSGNGQGILFETPGGGALTLSATTGAITGFMRIGQR